ncbi:MULTISPECIES: TetR-like C-terminal domain-containing protein [Streptomycetaceae]|uniref:Transcriptional regulator, TetR family protein n=1 Tax=Streptantibioticus cattleyicolor (strain ATCC 35852 / DSM 46488 / JCM 4925 / NBRC 14057 / NRRL 8057) TaxID=1003195 RepID=F8K0F4_STREN|nr:MULTISPECIES: TetR-like C-terminal domain-containing protein [Streptomycetaceae]AEW97359.1 transcriptional regulator, TetR family protein [Streptantibioticus cattleyicolor NRRL 8057 = DSM 46488]MYS61808.1 TetR family transcriptional regulator [Streptomyces sp. SID5468]CCB77681.1 putative TetR-family transcriptional regulator [Streptantibioticus cattleyicolor NRRL 8057 = DSM 46488]
MGRPRTNDDTVKERLVVCATEMLATRPRESVTVRALAAAAGASTTAVYSLFGGKDGLIAEVRGRAVAGLFHDLSAVPAGDDPLADLYALAVAYRRWAGEHSHLYTVLFGGVQSFDPSGAVGAADPVRPLLDAIDRALAASVLAGDVTSIALSVWVTLHGLVTLELAGALDAAMAEATFRTTVHATLRGWATPAVFRGLREADPVR